MGWDFNLLPPQVTTFDRGCPRDPRRIAVRGRLDPADSNDIQTCTTLADAGEMQEPLSVVHGIDGCCWCSYPDPRYILDLIHTC
ncbi:hypothetical protein Y032_0715g1773 [Ancylostoma ceylanicum]|nr:hypothetical protein Y032_0715g1773 [Ancylostoma ceylanicum]